MERKQLKSFSSVCKMSLHEEREEGGSVHTQTEPEPEPSCVSMKSDISMSLPPDLSDGSVTQTKPSPEPSCVSMKSDKSMDCPINFSDGSVTSDPVSLSKMSLHEEREEGGSVHIQTEPEPEPSCVSMKSDRSMLQPPDLSDESVTSDPVVQINYLKSSLTCTAPHSQTHIRHQLYFQQPVNDVLQRLKDTHKTSMKKKYEKLFEGIKVQENQTLLNRIYTQLYIIEGESEGVNEEHEVSQMEKTPRTQQIQDTPINCNDIFDSLPEPGYLMKKRKKTENIKSVLTKGIAGIGKTVSVQKFILDWAEGKANQDVDFMFVLPFRELNLIKDDQYSLHKLLLDFHPELQDLDSKIYDECKVVFIFDGLDESRITLMFSDSEKVSDVTETSSVSVLMSNLIKGELLPSALIWITSRPAAANQIPSKYINRVTEIQGFTDPQKEEYFRKRISDQDQASRIISHIKTARSLHIMCHIPVFCWISATVLQNILKEDQSAEIPQTLTEMYIHFLLIQINKRNQKYEERDPEKLLQSNRDVIVKLAEVAFKQLMKGNVMFYEEDLRECGIDVTEASVYSGICTEIFKEESVIYQRKVYCFIHLSFQELLAALYVFYSHVVKNLEALWLFLGEEFQEISLHELLMSAVNKSLQSKNGHLDLFLRFLLGISLESNQRLLQDLLTHTENSSEDIRKTAQYIKNKIKSGSRCVNENSKFRVNRDSNPDDLTAERSINLFLCLLEVNDQTLYREIQEFLKIEKRLWDRLSSAHCSAIAYMLQISEEVIDEIDLMKYYTFDEGRRRLIPAVMNCRKALLAHCNLTGHCGEIVTSVLQSSDSPLRDLDLGNNNLQYAEVKLISDALKSPNCKLEILRLTGCNLTGQCCESLTSVLQSSNSLLRDLDLSNNDLQDSGVKLISDGLKSLNCELMILRLAHCNLTDQCCESLASVLQSSNSLLRDLDLSNNDLQDSGVKLISDGLKSLNCKLEILRFSGCMVTEEGCCYLASALRSNPSHLRELDLSYNHPGDSGVKLLSDRRDDPNCTLNKLNVDHGGELMITAGIQKYACDLTLDPNTANNRQSLSEGNKMLSCVKVNQSYADHQEASDFCARVLCRESLSGRCYWEAEWSEGAEISVSYKGIMTADRVRDHFRNDGKSWSLKYSFGNRFFVNHSDKATEVPVPSPPSIRVGVYLDWSAGTLSFYSISDTYILKHVHTFRSTFTEPLYAGFKLYDSSITVSLCDIKQFPVRNSKVPFKERQTFLQRFRAAFLGMQDQSVQMGES